MSYRGEIKDGAVILENGIKLPDGTSVTVEPVIARAPATDRTDQNDELSGIADLAVETGIKDLARNADHYLYGHPRVDDAG